jgi:D-beta-D-heptose 7-phosphate kinase/D-beta-D-heptose 1-phosphate adenosyltransferase
MVTEVELLPLIDAARERGESIVMTNGCFDVIHPGHVAYLQEARDLGDRLIVAVNDDDSVRKLKGESRPVNTLADRMAVLAGLSSVDWVVPFSEDTPARLIQSVLPDILAKGGDYKPDEIAGSQDVIRNGGEVRILAYRAGHSSSNVIEKLSKQSS